MAEDLYQTRLNDIPYTHPYYKDKDLCFLWWDSYRIFLGESSKYNNVLTVNIIAKELEISRYTAHTVMEKLKKMGFIEVPAKGKGLKRRICLVESKGSMRIIEQVKKTLGIR